MTSKPGFKALVVLLALGGACGEQPRPSCTVSRATYAARYELVSGTGVCSMLVGEVLGAQAYLPDPDKAGDHYSMAIQSQALGARVMAGEAAAPPVVDANASHKSYAYGAFTADHPDATNVCSVPTLSDAELDQGALTAATTTLPATHLKYHWSNVRSFVTAANTGVEWGGDLEYTADGCTATYHVAAIAPMVSCADKDGKADAHLCDPYPDPASGFAGSGLNPDIAVQCEPTMLLCVPAQAFPSLKAEK